MIVRCPIDHHFPLRHFNDRKIQTSYFFWHCFQNLADVQFVTRRKTLCSTKMHMKDAHKFNSIFEPFLDLPVQIRNIWRITARRTARLSVVQDMACDHSIFSAKNSAYLWRLTRKFFQDLCSATSFLRNWDSILEKKRANLRSISEPARLRQPPPRSTGAAHARGRAQSIREERRIAAPPVLFALLWVRLLPALYGPFCGPLRPFGGCPWGVTPPARECLPPAPPDTRRRG